MRTRLVILLSAGILLLAVAFWYSRSRRLANQAAISANVVNESVLPPSTAPLISDSNPTVVYAHNLLLRKGPDFRIYVPWLGGNMVRTHRNVNPSFDDPESFLLDVKTGVIRANIGDIGNFLNVGNVKGSPLRNIALVADGDQIKLTGSLHKLISMPIELLGTVAATADNRIQVHVTKLSVLKIPLKDFLVDYTSASQTSFSPRESQVLRSPGMRLFSTPSNYSLRPIYAAN